MEKIKNDYKKYGAIGSKLTEVLWNTGNLFVLIILFISTKKGVELSIFAIILFIILYIICDIIFVAKVKNQIKIRNKFVFFHPVKYRKGINIEIKRFQKNWIHNYCKHNRINSIEKLKYILKRLQDRKEKIYLWNMVTLFITLMIPVIEILLEYVDKNLKIIFLFLLVWFFTLIGGYAIFKLSYYFKKYVMDGFQDFSNEKNLELLLEEEMLYLKK